MSAEKVREYLLTHGIEYEIGEHPIAYTAQKVAEAEHVSGHHVAKPVMLMTGDRMVMAVLPASRHVDLAKAKEAFGADDVRLATETEFAPLFADCDQGAETPLGSLYGVPVALDTRVTSERIMFRGGSHSTSITMRLADYLAIVRPTVVDIAAGV